MTISALCKAPRNWTNWPRPCRIMAASISCLPFPACMRLIGAMMRAASLPVLPASPTAPISAAPPWRRRAAAIPGRYPGYRRYPPGGDGNHGSGRRLRCGPCHGFLVRPGGIAGALAGGSQLCAKHGRRDAACASLRLGARGGPRAGLGSYPLRRIFIRPTVTDWYRRGDCPIRNSMSWT